MTELPTRFVKALESKYQAKIDEGIATIDLYMTRSAGVGEHPDVISVLDEYISMVETNTAKLNLVKTVFSPPLSEQNPEKQ
jgi:hypothetical protein|tara:strand:+ start:215 stop:457 length:243 start_codon:yes stop_codon:yes gene_type:complete